MQKVLNGLCSATALTAIFSPSCFGAGVFLTQLQGSFPDTNELLRFDAQSGVQLASFNDPNMESNYDLKRDTQGNLYLAGMSVGDGGVAGLSADGSKETSLYFSNNVISTYYVPGRIAFGINGILYASTISSISSDTTNAVGSILELNAKTGAYLGRLDYSTTSGDYINDLEFGPDDQLYASWSKSGLWRYEANGSPVLIDSKSAGDIAFGPDDDLYAIRNNSIVRYNSSGQFLGTFVASDPSRPDLTEMTFGPDGDIYAIERTHLTIERFDGNSGAWVNTFASLVPSGTTVPGDSFESIIYSPVPEPTVGALMLTGISVIGLRRRRA